jgi:hypothetical protein
MIATTASFLLLASVAQAPAAPSYPLLDAVAARLVQKYNSATCADLAKERQAPASAQKEAMKDRAGDALRNDPAMRANFVNKVAPTVVNKMVVCGFIP